MSAPETVWFDEPTPSVKTGSWSDCMCIRHGDYEDVSACEIHSKTRASAVKLTPFTDDPCPF